MSADARSYLVQQLARFRSAASKIDRDIKELQADIIMVLAAIDDLEAQAVAAKDAA